MPSRKKAKKKLLRTKREQENPEGPFSENLVPVGEVTQRGRRPGSRQEL